LADLKDRFDHLIQELGPVVILDKSPRSISAPANHTIEAKELQYIMRAARWVFALS
jgi:hypothetical protein